MKSQRVADGVYFLTGGTHHSLAIEMSDFIVLVDTPNGEARASALVTKVKQLIPGRPLRYIIVTHHHWDHLGGIRTAIDEGATIVTHETNREFLERAANAPHTINPDRLSISKKSLRLQTVGDEGTLTDGSRTIELYRMTGFDHAGDMLMVYLPNERILAEAGRILPRIRRLLSSSRPRFPARLRFMTTSSGFTLDVQTIVPFRGGRTVDLSEVARQGGKR